MALWGKKNTSTNSNLAIIEKLTDSIVRLNEVGSLGYALVGLSVIVIVVAVVASLTSDVLLRTITGILPWLFGLVIVLGSFGVVLLSVERIAGIRLAELKMQMIVSMTEEMLRASLNNNKNVDGLQVVGAFDHILKKIWGLEPESSAASRQSKSSTDQI